MDFGWKRICTQRVPVRSTRPELFDGYSYIMFVNERKFYMPWLDAMLAYTHFVSIIFVSSTLIIEAVLCRPGLTLVWAQRLGRVDLLYLVAAVLVLASGLLRLFLGLKGSAFYTGNLVFWVKMGLFVAVGLISIVPTIRFIRWQREMKDDETLVISDRDLTGTLRIIYLELVLLALIPLMAVMMSRGIGLGWWGW